MGGARASPGDPLPALLCPAWRIHDGVSRALRRSLGRILRAPEIRQARRGGAPGCDAGTPMTALRVLHVDVERGFSGGETQVLALARHLREFGHRQTIAAHPDGLLAQRCRSESLDV